MKIEWMLFYVVINNQYVYKLKWYFLYEKNIAEGFCHDFINIFSSLIGRHGRDRMIVGFTTTCIISVYHHYSCELESRSWRGVLHTTLCDKVCQWLATCWWFSPVSSTNKNWPPRHSWNIVESGVKHHKQ